MAGCVIIVIYYLLVIINILLAIFLNRVLTLFIYRKEMKNPLVSVIIPVYNVEKYLRHVTDSICNQTFRELEIIVVDDGSTDRSGCIAEEFAQKDCRIRVVHKRNGNPGATRNVGLELVNGEYIGFVDSDDWIDPAMYEKLYQAAQATKADLVVTGVCVGVCP